jgi:hypothetical protein
VLLLTTLSQEHATCHAPLRRLRPIGVVVVTAGRHGDNR